MKKVFMPYYRLLFKIMQNKKILGKASKQEKEDLAKKVSELISRVQSTRTKEEIYQKIRKKIGRIIYTEQLPSFLVTQGSTLLTGTMCLDKEDVDAFFGQENDVLDNDECETVVHEFTHLLQGSFLYKGESIRGFLEGATDLIALRTVMKNRSTKYSNRNGFNQLS